MSDKGLISKIQLNIKKSSTPNKKRTVDKNRHFSIENTNDQEAHEKMLIATNY